MKGRGSLQLHFSQSAEAFGLSRCSDSPPVRHVNRDVFASRILSVIAMYICRGGCSSSDRMAPVLSDWCAMPYTIEARLFYTTCAVADPPLMAPAPAATVQCAGWVLEARAGAQDTALCSSPCCLRSYDPPESHGDYHLRTHDDIMMTVAIIASSHEAGRWPSGGAPSRKHVPMHLPACHARRLFYEYSTSIGGFGFDESSPGPGFYGDDGCA